MGLSPFLNDRHKPTSIKPAKPGDRRPDDPRSDGRQQAAAEGLAGIAPYGRNIRTWICGGQQISTKCALFDPANYTGEKVDDPFEEWEYFVDVAQLWQLQNAAIAGKRRGWPGVEVFEIGQHFENWKYQKVAKKDGGKVYICPNRDGSVSIYDGFLPNAEARKVEKAKDREENPAEGNTERKAARPELTSWGRRPT